MSRGEVWWHEAPDEKPRPFLVLTRDVGIASMAKVLGVPTTTSIRGLPTEVVLTYDDGMPRECVLSLDNVTPVVKAHLTVRIAALGPERMAKVCRALRAATDC